LILAGWTDRLSRNVGKIIAA